MHFERRTVDDFTFHVEVWDNEDLYVEELMAVAVNIHVARAAFEAAKGQRPGKILRLRQGAFVVASHNDPPYRELQPWSERKKGSGVGP